MNDEQRAELERYANDLILANIKTEIIVCESIEEIKHYIAVGVSTKLYMTKSDIDTLLHKLYSIYTMFFEIKLPKPEIMARGVNMSSINKGALKDQIDNLVIDGDYGDGFVSYDIACKYSMIKVYKSTDGSDGSVYIIRFVCPFKCVVIDKDKHKGMYAKFSQIIRMSGEHCTIIVDEGAPNVKYVSERKVINLNRKD